MPSPTIDPALFETSTGKAALAEIQALDTPEKITAKATELGLADRWKQIQADTEVRKAEAQTLDKDVQAHLVRRKEYEDRAKSAMKKASVSSWVGAVAGVSISLLGTKNKSWGGLRKFFTWASSGIVGSVVLGSIGNKIISPGLKANGEALEKENQALLQKRDEMVMRDGEIKAQFVQEMAQKIIERNQAPHTTFRDKLKAEQASPQTAQARG